MQNWRPIYTAEFDDSVIMLWRKGDSRAYAGWWIGGDGEYDWAFVDETRGSDPDKISPNAYSKAAGPTHWMPLPEPPQ